LISIFSLHPQGGLIESHGIEDLPRLCGGDRPFWVNLIGIEEDELVDVLSDQFHFHELSIEDCIHRNQNAKVEEYPGYLFIVVHTARLCEGATFETDDLHMFLGKNYIVTVYEKELPYLSSLETDLRRNPSLLERGPDWVLHQVCDRVVDAYLPVMDRFDEAIDDLEDSVFNRPSAGLLDHIFQLKKGAMHLRRLSVQQREVFLNMSRGRYELVNAKTAIYMRDVYDHLVRISDVAEGYRDLVAGSLEIYLSVASNRLNEIVKVLTIFSAIILPLNLISSIYGMNFQHMPELRWEYGYPAVLSLMAVLTVGMLLYFRRKNWL
jgi:magnesium transporter